MSKEERTSSESAVQYEETPVEQLTHPRARTDRAGRHAEAGRGRICSGDANRYAYTVYGSDPRRPSHVVVDGRECPTPSDRGGHFVFSRGGGRLAYVADDGDGQAVVCDGIPGRTYDSAEPPVFAAGDASRCAYSARRGDRALVVCDETEGPDFDEVGDVVFSPDGARLAYWGDAGAGVLALIEGLPDALHLSVSNILFSPNGDRVAYVAGSGERLAEPPDRPSPSTGSLRGHKGSKTTRMAVVLDGEIGPSHDEVDNLQFSADGGRFAYFARRDDGVALIVDGTEMARWPHQPHRGATLRFSPDGQHIACVLPHDQGDALFVDGELVAVHQAIYEVMFSPEGGHLAYMVSDGSVSWAVLDGRRVGQFAARNCYPRSVGERCLHQFDAENGRRVYVDGRYVLTYSPPESYHGAALSRDGTRVLLHTDDGLLVLDGRPIASVGTLPAPGPIFSPDGRHIAYVEGGTCVLDGVRGPSFRTIGAGVFNPHWEHYEVFGCDGEQDESVWLRQLYPGFSVDSRHLAYVAGSRDGEFVVVDGAMSPRYDELVGPVGDPGTGLPDGDWARPTPFVWEKEGLRFMGVRGGLLYRVTARVGSAAPRLPGADLRQA